MAKEWAKREEMALFQGAGVYGFAWFESHTGDSYDWENAPKGRSRDAVKAKARRLYQSGITRGSYTLNQICKKTGYDKKQVRRAMVALAQKWKRTSPHGSFLIYEEQVEDIIQWLKTDYWATKHRLYNCLWCGTEKRPHRSAGLCQRCYYKYTQKLFRAGLPIGAKGLLGVLRTWKIQSLEKAEQDLSRGRALSMDVLGLVLKLQKSN